MSDAAHVTKHARDRLRSRMGLSGGAPRRMAERAYREGIPVERLTGDLRSFVEGKIQEHQLGHEARVYGETLWVLEGKNLITVYVLTHALRPAAREAWAKHRGET